MTRFGESRGQRNESVSQVGDSEWWGKPISVCYIKTILYDHAITGEVSAMSVYTHKSYEIFMNLFKDVNYILFLMETQCIFFMTKLSMERSVR